MASWVISTLPLKQLVSYPAALFRTLTGTDSCTTCDFKPNKLYKSKVLTPHVTEKCMKVISRVVDSEHTPMKSHVGFWEDPDDGSESEYEDEEQEAEENDLDFESDWEEEKNSLAPTFDEKQTSLSYEEEFTKEIEGLLGPEELSIWEQNADPNIQKISTEKWNPLHTLALSGQIHFLDRLIENGVNIDTPDKDGLTALHISVTGKKEAVISHLLRKGANPHLKDKDGATPLHYAVQVGAIQTVKLLIKYGVDLNTSDNEGWTPLHVAMQSRNRDIAKVLLVNGADKTRKNKDGRTPLDLSLAYGKDFKSYDLAKLLKVLPANRDL